MTLFIVHAFLFTSLNNKITSLCMSKHPLITLLLVVMVTGGLFFPRTIYPSNLPIVALLRPELDYITSASFSEANPFSKEWGFLEKKDDIYGALNVTHTADSDPAAKSWVNPGESAMASVGMMQGAIHLTTLEEDINQYDVVLKSFFENWILSRHAQNIDSTSPDHGAFPEQVFYNSDGMDTAENLKWQTDDTAQIIIAMYKYYEYLVRTGKATEANKWLETAEPIAKDAVNYLIRMYQETPAKEINLLPSNASDLTVRIHSSANAVPALEAMEHWANHLGQPKSRYRNTVEALKNGLLAMRDNERSGFFTERRYNGTSYELPSYAENINQSVFSPYETGAIPIDAFVADLSDWWLANMTYTSTTEDDWRYFGTHWHKWFDNREENNYLYPGPGFQLAKIEWMYAEKFKNKEYAERSKKRLNWATSHSNLWWSKNHPPFSKVTNGFQDWVDSKNENHKAEEWARFIDTSAYYIQVLLMHEADIGTDYNPTLP